jgi:hypothetical protein
MVLGEEARQLVRMRAQIQAVSRCSLPAASYYSQRRQGRYSSATRSGDANSGCFSEFQALAMVRPMKNKPNPAPKTRVPASIPVGSAGGPLWANIRQRPHVSCISGHRVLSARRCALFAAVLFRHAERSVSRLLPMSACTSRTWRSKGRSASGVAACSAPLNSMLGTKVHEHENVTR